MKSKPKNLDFFEEKNIKFQKHKARQLRSSQWWKRVCAKGLCHYCKRSFPAKDLTMDHIVPISKGGKSTKGNVVAACKECNTQKRQLLLMDWEKYLENFK